ncbi:MAG: LamG domain-containing protein [Nitrospinae bacterium]|nr:LamG domain-containing protein [Nitrospinota bacterium]
MKKQVSVFMLFSLLLVLSTTASADQLTMQEGANIDLSVTPGPNSTITISATDTNTDEKVKVSGSDTADFLESQIVGGTGVTINSDGNQITISAPPVNVEDSADGVEITFANEFDTPPGSGENLAIDINGTNLNNPTVTVGGVLYNVQLPTPTNISGPLPNMQQVIVTPPPGTIRSAGHHKLKLVNANGFSEGLVLLKAITSTIKEGLVGYWPMDGDFNDESPSGNNGAPNGGVTATSQDSKFGQAASFDGVNKFVSLGSTGLLVGNSARTFAAWIKTTSDTARQTIIGYGSNANSQNIDFELNTLPVSLGKMGMHIWGGLPIIATTDTVVTDNLNKFMHVAFVYTGTDFNDAKFYVNGEEQTFTFTSLGDASSTLNTVFSQAYIGKRSLANDNPFNGIIDDLAVWDRALSASEISIIVSSESPIRDL